MILLGLCLAVLLKSDTNPNCREISERAGIFLGYQIQKNWYILGFGTNTNILTPLSLYPLNVPPPPPPPGYKQRKN